jgi:hypothetical protein
MELVEFICALDANRSHTCLQRSMICTAFRSISFYNRPLLPVRFLTANMVRLIICGPERHVS